MTDNKIISALKICTSEDLGCEDDCPYLEFCKQDIDSLEKAALDLINRQKAEIEKKDTEIDILIRKKEALRDEISALSAEVERRKAEKVKLHTLIPKMLVEAKSEAYREFWMKLRTHGHKMMGSDWSGEFCAKAILVEDGDNLLKELTESKNDFKE